MQKLSIKILLRFLKSYSHWNLVRRQDGYHLYFVTKDNDAEYEEDSGKQPAFQSEEYIQTPRVALPRMTSRRKRGHLHQRKQKSRRHSQRLITQENGVGNDSCQQRCLVCRAGSALKDIFVFSPIFDTVDEAIQVGLKLKPSGGILPMLRRPDDLPTDRQPLVRGSRSARHGRLRSGYSVSTVDTREDDGEEQDIDEDEEEEDKGVLRSVSCEDDLKSKRSSFESLAWDEFLPYQREDNRTDDDDQSFATLENSTDLDSKESTPFILEDVPQNSLQQSSLQKSSYYEICVRNEADRLLKDMLQLRKDIEAMNYVPEAQNTVKILEEADQLTTNGETIESEKLDEENNKCFLQNRLDLLTEEIKNEMKTAISDEPKMVSSGLDDVEVDLNDLQDDDVPAEAAAGEQYDHEVDIDAMSHDHSLEDNVSNRPERTSTLQNESSNDPPPMLEANEEAEGEDLRHLMSKADGKDIDVIQDVPYVREGIENQATSDGQFNIGMPNDALKEDNAQTEIKDDKPQHQLDTEIKKLEETSQKHVEETRTSGGDEKETALKGGKTRHINSEDQNKMREFFENIVKKTPNKIEELQDKQSQKQSILKTNSEKKNKPSRDGSSRGRSGSSSSNSTVSIKNEKGARLEIPFCSHSNSQSGSKQPGSQSGSRRMNEPITGRRHSSDAHAQNRRMTTLERRRKKKDLRTILTPDDKYAAKEILQELIDLRDRGKSKAGDRNPVLDSIISTISLSSVSLSLPASTTSSDSTSLPFRDLLDFEVNISESKSAFAKLAGSSKGSITLQELFPWSGDNTNPEDANLQKIRNRLQ